LTSADEENVEHSTIIITEEDRESFKRLDVFLQQRLKQYSRTFIKSLFELDLISSEAVKLELKKLPAAGTVIEIEIPPPLPANAQAENIPLEILFQDEHLLLINKVAGMVTHPAPGNYTGTLVNAVLHHCPDLKGVGNEKRPGIVHRLDKGTSGVMVVAKTQTCHERLVTLFSTHNLVRRYEALIVGTPPLQSGSLGGLIGRHPKNRLKMSTHVRVGKRALTHYKVLGHYDSITHLELTLETGRTHQIRVHLSELLNTPILMDGLYATPTEQLKKIPKQIKELLTDYPHPLLHAKTLEFIHPITNVPLSFTVPAPEVFQNTLKNLK